MEKKSVEKYKERRRNASSAGSNCNCFINFGPE